VSAQPQTLGPVDNRALLSAVGHRLIRKVLDDVGPHAEALFAIICERKPIGEPWDSKEWAATIEEIEASELTVAEWLSDEHARKAKR
jgi:hypothetical protein